MFHFDIVFLGFNIGTYLSKVSENMAANKQGFAKVGYSEIRCSLGRPKGIPSG